ncbi:MAG: cell division protein FtsA [Terriglobia bacterium]
MIAHERLLAALDLGSSKVTVLIGEATDSGRILLRGSGVAESKGFHKDTLVHLGSAVEALRQAVETAEHAADAVVESAVVGVAGRHVRSFNSRGGVSLGARPREVEADDIRRAIEAARAVSLPPDQELLHVLPQEFLLDKQDGIRDALGLLGRRLEVNVHLVTSAAMATQNLVTAVNRAGLMVEDTVLEPLAAADACLTPDEKQLGAVVVDLGAGSTEWFAFERGTPRATGLVPVGGEHFTNDIAVCLRTPLWEAERVKRAYGCATLRGTAQDTLFEVAGMGERPPRVASRRALGEILEPRAQEWAVLVREALENGLGALPLAGVVLTGGAAQLEGLADLAAQALQVPMRLGLAKGLSGANATLANPASAVAVGLLLHANRLRLAERRNGGLVSRLKKFFAGNGRPRVRTRGEFTLGGQNRESSKERTRAELRR